MKRLTGMTAAACMAVIAGCSGEMSGGSSDDGWITLFDGTSFDGWNRLGDANWRLEDGAFVADGGSGFLVSDQAFGDFELRLEFWVDPEANSGVFIRCADANEVTAANSYEVNIFDTRPDQTYRTGGIVNVAAPLVTLYTGDRWNTYDIVAEGSRLHVTLNDTLTLDTEDEAFASGPIALQYGSGTVKFRNVQIRAL